MGSGEMPYSLPSLVREVRQAREFDDNGGKMSPLKHTVKPVLNDHPFR